MGRKESEFPELSEADRRQLEVWVRGRKTGQALAIRARIVLGSADGASPARLARTLDVTSQTVSKWRRRFAERGVPGLLDAVRSGAPRRIDDGNVSAVIKRTLEKPPGESSYWSTRLMAREMGMSQSAISRIWRGCGLQPRHQERFSLVGDADFAARLGDVVGVYLDPPTKVLALSMHAQAARAAAAQANVNADQLREERELLRCKLGPLVRGPDRPLGDRERARPRHSVRSLVQFLRTVDSRVPADMGVQLMLNNAEVYKLPSVFRWFLKHSRFRLRFTPSAAAWRQQAEHVFALLGEGGSVRSKENSTAALKQAMEASPDWAPHHPQVFIWVRPRPERD